MELILQDIDNGLDLTVEKSVKGISYRISRPTKKTNTNKFNGYAKFFYFSSVKDPTDSGRFEEIILFNFNQVTEQEAKLIFGYISDCFKSFLIKDLKESIKYIQSTFGKILGFTKEKVIGKIGELLFIKHCLENNLNISSFFHEKENSLFDFYLNNNNKYLEIKTVSTEALTISLNIKQLTYKPDDTIFGVIKIKEDQNGNRLLDLIQEILSYKEIDLILRDYLTRLQNIVVEDIFCEEVKYDTKNILYFIYLENVIQNKVGILEELSDEKNWKHIESIKLSINLSGIDTSSFLDFKNKIGK